jgi:hypothetical protein
MIENQKNSRSLPKIVNYWVLHKYGVVIPISHFSENEIPEIEAISKLGFRFKIKVEFIHLHLLLPMMLLINLSIKGTCYLFCCFTDQHGIHAYGDQIVTFLDKLYNGVRSSTKYTEWNVSLLCVFSYFGDRILNVRITNKANFPHTSRKIVWPQ